MIVEASRGHRTRVGVVAAALVATVLAATLVALTTGSAGIDAWDALRALAGYGTPDDVVVVQSWRLSRAVAAVVLGAALGVAGSLLQQSTRNALGSPDVIGFDAGAFTGVLVTGVLLGGTLASITAGALVGGLVTAACVIGIARAAGGEPGQLVVVGIAAGAFLASANAWIVLAADDRVALTASGWALGSLAEITWQRLAIVIVALVVAAIPTALLIAPTRILELGDDLAEGLGVPSARTRALIAIVAVALSASVTAASGPIAFVALAAPHVAALLVGRAGFHPLWSALVGATLLAVSDVVAQRALPGLPLPVGAVTIVAGGAYLVALTIWRGRAGRGGV